MKKVEKRLNKDTIIYNDAPAQNNTIPDLSQFPSTLNLQTLTPQTLLYLQSTIGNQAVSQLLAGGQQPKSVKSEQAAPVPVLNKPRTVKTQNPFSTSIRIMNDSMPGETEQQAANTPSNRSLLQQPELQVGQSIALPDIHIPYLSAYAASDAIAGTLAYQSSITNSGAEPPGFGQTRPTATLQNINVTRNTNTFTVTATYNRTITYQVRSTSGPTGQVNVTSATDSNINARNYPAVVTDLTPNMADMNGRPPRHNYWNKALTLRHERFHADEDVAYAQQGVTAAQAWLGLQTAANLTEVQQLVMAIPARVANTVAIGMAFPGRENRAYGDGASHYTTLANAIQAKGTNGDYT